MSDSAAPAGERVVTRIEVPHRRYLDAAGTAVATLPPCAGERPVMVGLYEAMVLTRVFDTKAVALQRTGQLGTYPSCLGQEAVAVGFASVMRDDDVLLPTYREQGAQIWRGVTLSEILQYWGGDERGCDYQGPREDFPVAVPIASHATHAAGVAAAFKLRGEQRVAVCALGDGATAKGDFHEALNFAAVWQLPVLFMVINNQWAISVPVHKQRAADTLAQQGPGVGVAGVQVDGNDVIAVRQVTDEALARARAGGGPTLIEAVTYRLGDHTTADDATRYRSQEEVQAAWQREPVARLRAYLHAKGWWSEADEERLQAQCKARVEAAVTAFQEIPPASPQDIFSHLFETLPKALHPQLRRLASGRDD